MNDGGDSRVFSAAERRRQRKTAAQARRRPGRFPALTPTARRLGLIGVGLLLAAINTGNNVLYLLLALLLAAIPVSWSYLVMNLRALSFDLELPPHPRAGSPFTLEIVIQSRRRWISSRSIAIRVLTEDGVYGPVRVERVPPGATMPVRVSARETERGCRRIVGVVAESVFPLGLLRHGIFHDLPRELLVLPRSAANGRGRERSDELPGTAASSTRIAGIEPEGSRRGDVNSDVRQVDWKSTARRGELMLRETSGESNRRLDLDLATRLDQNTPAARRRFEQTVSAIAGRASRALESDGTVRLTIDGAEPSIHRGRSGLSPLLTRLARVVPSGPDGRPLGRLTTKQELAGPADETSIALRRTPPGRVHHGSALLALGVSVTALFAYEGINFVLFAVTIASLLATTWIERLKPRPGGWMSHLWNGVGVVALLLFLGALVTGGNPLTASIYLLTFITLFQLFNAWTWRDDRRMLLVSMLHLVLAAALTTDFSFVAFLLGWMVAAIHGQLAWTALPPSGTGSLRGLRFESAAPRIRYGAASVANLVTLLAIGSLIFLILPHFGTGTFGRSRARSVSGFSEETRLGDIGKIKLDDSKVMDVSVRGRLPRDVDLRWRGLALEQFDGRKWSRTWRDMETFTPKAGGRFETGRGATDGNRRDLIVQEIRLEPLETQVLFAAERPEEVVSDDFRILVRDEGDGLQARKRPGRPVSYTVASSLAPRDPTVLRRATEGDPVDLLPPNLQLPELDPRIAQLASEITAGTATRFDAALAIETWLSTNHTYSLDVRDQGRQDPIAAFLFEEMPGHCEYFASSMVILARSAGIPSRLVTGYLRGETNRFSRRYIVRQNDAHAWVEIYFPGAGWVPFDPTPPEGRGSSEDVGLVDFASDLYATAKRWWDDYYIGIDISDQVRSLLALRAGLVALAGRISLAAIGKVVFGVLFLALAGLAAQRLLTGWTRPSPHRGAPRFYRDLLQHLARRGLERRATETPAELAERSGRTLPEAASRCVRQLTELYYRVRFDEATTERDVGTLARSLLAELEHSHPTPR